MSTALTTGERNTFDDVPFVYEVFLYIYEPDTVFEAAISSSNDAETHTGIATSGSPTKGSFADIKAGMTVELEDGSGNPRGRQRVRSVSDPNIFTGRAPRSNFEGGLNPNDATVVKVYDEYRAFAKIPYIDPAGTQLRDEQAYPGADEAQPPLANNAFPATLLISEDGNARTVQFDANLSRAIRDGAVLSSYSWDFGDGTVVTGSTSTVDPSVSFPVGDRYVDLTITDDNGVSDTTRILVCVIERSQLIPARITSRSRGVNENALTIEAPADLLSTDIRDGSPILVSDNSSIGDITLRFYGWLGEVSSRYTDPVNDVAFVSITCEDIATRLRKLVSFPQVVTVASDATGTWQALPEIDIRVLIHHMLRWYSNALEIATLDIGSVVYNLPQLEAAGNTLFDQFDKLAQAVAHRLSVDMTGVMRIIGDPAVLPTSAQQSAFSGLVFARDTTVRTTLTQDDYANPRFTYTYMPRVSWARAAAVVEATSADDLRVVESVAPSKTPGQGTSEASDTELLVGDGVPQVELNIVTGHRYASRKDNPFGRLQIDVAKSSNIFDPALMQVFKVQLPSTLKDRHGISDDDLWLLNQVEEDFDPVNGVKTATVTLERITEGEPAETVSQPPPPDTVDEVDEAAIDPFATGELADLVDGDPVYNLDGLSDNIVAILENGKFAVTSNGGTNWTVNDHSATIGSSVYSWCLKAGATAVSGWVVTSDGVFYVQNAQNGSPTFTDQTPSGETTFSGIGADFLNAPGEIVIVSGTDGTLDALYVSTDAGSTFTQRTGYGQRASHTVLVDSAQFGIAYAGVDRGDLRARIWRTTDYFATGSILIDDIDLNNDPPLAVSVDRPDFLFYGGDALYRYQVSTGNQVSINGDAPIRPGPAGVGINNRFVISVNPNNANDLAYVTSSDEVKVTHNALSSAPTWYTLTGPSSPRMCALVNSGAGLYVFGGSGDIYYTGSTYADGAMTSLIGDLSTTANIIGIAGY